MKHLGLHLRLTIVTSINTESGTFGKGIATLLRGIEDHGSLNASAKKMHMAYSKAWRIVNETEAGFGFNLIDRDGARGSTLTPEGKKLLSVYEQLEAAGTEYLNAQFKEMLDTH